ncbi:hypothetical protein EDB80DRAFT_867079 [Ilyonectria destructans]|nr:hypothetical protein EDB80DRAFT_867079 [Ilyonectria destructans]
MEFNSGQGEIGDSTMNKPEWSLDYLEKPHEMTIHCPEGYQFTTNYPQGWGEQVICSTYKDPKQITVADAVTADASPPTEEFWVDIPLNHLPPDQKIINVHTQGLVWKLSVVIEEDRSIKFGICLNSEEEKYAVWGEEPENMTNYVRGHDEESREEVIKKLVKELMGRVVNLKERAKDILYTAEKLCKEAEELKTKRSSVEDPAELGE